MGPIKQLRRSLPAALLLSCVLCMHGYAHAQEQQHKYDYYDYNEYVTLLATLKAESDLRTPSILAVETIGYSYEGHPIYAVKISVNPETDDEQKPDVLIDGGIHAREWISSESCIHFIQYVFDAYYDNAHPDHAEIDEIVNEFEIWIIPMINPDGRMRDDLNNGDPCSFWRDPLYHPGDIEGWRTNVQDVYCAAADNDTNIGIDLNRNFSAYWEKTPCESETYGGHAPFSAPETRALKDFINNHMISLVLNQHAYAQLFASATGFFGRGSYLVEELVDIYSQGLPNPALELWNLKYFIDMPPPCLKPAFMQARTVDASAAAFKAKRGSMNFSGIYVDWLWNEVDLSAAPDYKSRRAIQSITYEFGIQNYGLLEDGLIGQYAREDGSNNFHPSSAETVHWLLDKSIDLYKYFIKQSRYPFSPRHNEDMSRKACGAPVHDLALVGAKISEAEQGLPGCLRSAAIDGRDILSPGLKRITWNVQNNGVRPAAIKTKITVCDLADGPLCPAASTHTFTNTHVAPEEIHTYTLDFYFEPNKDYTVTLMTGERNTYNNDVKRFVFSTYTNERFVHLVDLFVTPGDKNAYLQWETDAEAESAGFYLYRAETENGEYTKINNEFILSQGLPDHGAVYTFVDSNIANGKTYWYRLENVGRNGTANLLGTVFTTPQRFYKFLP